MTDQVPAMTVVVPTRDRPDQLAACLAALEAQTVTSFEIVVVDDGSRDPAAVAAAAAGSRRARLLRGAGAGPAAARNLGALAARAAVVCLTDDDCRPGPGWLEAIEGQVRGGAVAIAGPTRNGRRDDRCATASQLLTNHLTEASHDPLQRTVAFAPTSNLALRVELHRLLPFDEGYPLAAGEDRDWCARLAALGVPLRFEPSAWVSHHQELSLRGFWRQQLRYGRGAGRMHARRAGGPRRQPLRFYVDLLRKGFAAGPAVGALVLLAQVAVAVGIIVEGAERRRSSGGVVGRAR